MSNHPGVIHTAFKPPIEAESIEDMPGMSYMLVRHWWPQVLDGKSALHIIDTLCGALAMAGSLGLTAVYDDIYMLINVATEIHKQTTVEGK